ncbi:hypothetical protein SDC9_179412 [bioreactor metagenome]|uniref:DUF3006 domain-containing protein n=1 Tax=bioreactor metagenome TaxID=1076179 RepID=A0A645GYV4_9ZZZZ
MRCLIDSIENNGVKFETGDEGIICLPKSLLPDGAREGDIVDITNGRITLCPDETQKRRTQITKLMDGMWE